MAALNKAYENHRPQRDPSTTRKAVPYEEQLQCEVPPNSKYSSRFLV